MLFGATIEREREVSEPVSLEAMFKSSALHSIAVPECDLTINKVVVFRQDAGLRARKDW